MVVELCVGRCDGKSSCTDPKPLQKSQMCCISPHPLSGGRAHSGFDAHCKFPTLCVPMLASQPRWEVLPAQDSSGDLLLGLTGGALAWDLTAPRLSAALSYSPGAALAAVPLPWIQP